MVMTRSPLKVKLGSEFEIVLESNPSTGYIWTAGFDYEILMGKGCTFEPKMDGIGGAGTIRFSFIPLKAGETTIRMICKRPWEDLPIEEQVYSIIVDM